MATLSLINFPKFSGSKEFLKIGRSEVCVWGEGAKGETIKLSRSVYIYINAKKLIPNHALFNMHYAVYRTY